MNYSSYLIWRQVFERHARSAHGSLFFIMPRLPAIDQEAPATLLQLLRSHGVLRRRWVWSVEEARAVIGSSHPHLFAGEPLDFEVYRLDREALHAMFEALEAEVAATAP